MPVQTQHRFNVAEYYRMAETGVLPPHARVELLDGKILDMSPIGPIHGGIVKRLSRFLNLGAKGRWIVSTQEPVQLDEHSEPEPDVMLLKPVADDYTSRHPVPEDVLLLIEVSDTTLDYDLQEKVPAYGRAGISEVWIVNLKNGTIEVYREPHFTGFGSKAVLSASDKAVPQAFPDVTIQVGELLKR
jgi:Uma2 family endonuclease